MPPVTPKYMSISRSRSRGRTQTRKSSAKRTYRSLSLSAVRKQLFSKRKRYLTAPQKGEYQGRFTKKLRKNPFQTYTSGGVVETREWGCVLTGQINTRPVFVGHATHGSYDMIRLQFIRAMVRGLFKKGGVNFQDFFDTPPPTAIIRLFYVTGSVNGSNAQIVTTAPAVSYEAIVTQLDVLINAQINSAAGQQFFQISAAFYEDAGTIFRINYQDLYIDVYCKSSLKIQNRTIATGTDDDINSTENVANQPLYGKAYRGKGNGVITKVNRSNSEGMSILANSKSGLLAFSPGITQPFLHEPPLPSLFFPAPKTSNAALEPGAIKSDVLTSRMYLSQIDFWRILTAPNNVGDSKGFLPQNRYGKFTMFALEKILCVAVADTVPVLGVELNQRMGLKFSYKTPPQTAEIINVANYATQTNG